MKNIAKLWQTGKGTIYQFTMTVVLGWFCSNIFFANPFFCLVDENSITNAGFINQLLENLFSIRAQEFENNIVLIYV